MLDHLFTLHRGSVDRFVIVAAPAAVQAFADFAADGRVPLDVAVQHEPTGMLDAILAAAPFVAKHRPGRVAVTWCDQIALRPPTLGRVRERAFAPGAPDLVLPTITVDTPYIHFDRADDGRIVSVRQRREGDAMPPRGETDMGLFDLSLEAYLEMLPQFATSLAAASGTGERNFLPFIPWLAARGRVETVAGDSPIEAVGINTAEDLLLVERELNSRTASER
jgi:bifunctional N-acetylglucosamine-1-phosphate-uridyltransferase/glucosamine-1-phosphate-acetyltransferase GlmU-like protein